jgi:hypothetical protein
VTFFDGTKSLGTAALDSHGAAGFSISALGAGPHSLTAVYAGNGNFAGSTSAAAALTITKVNTSTTLAASPTSSVVGQAVTLTAVIATATGGGTPTGTVTFLDGTTTLGTAPVGADGKATFHSPGLTLGSHNLTAHYGGDANDQASTSPAVGVVVAAVVPQVALSADAPAPVYGQILTFTAHVTAAATGQPLTGTVTFKDGATVLGTVPLNHGAASLAVPTLLPGGHTITAVYGDPAHGGAASAPLTETVAVAPVLVTLSLPGTAGGRPLTLTATVAAQAPSLAKPTGTVTFSDGTTVLGTGTLDSTGKATLSLPHGLTRGTHHIAARFNGTSLFAAGQAAGVLTVA